VDHPGYRRDPIGVAVAARPVGEGRSGEVEPAAIVASIETMVADVAAYVPGYRLHQDVQVTPVERDEPLGTLIGTAGQRPRWKVAVFLRVEGAGHYLPPYAGNLDIMTSAAIRTAERLSSSSLSLSGSEGVIGGPR
jgi:acetaldehyde dehydrogenase